MKMEIICCLWILNILEASFTPVTLLFPVLLRETVSYCKCCVKHLNLNFCLLKESCYLSLAFKAQITDFKVIEGNLGNKYPCQISKINMY